MEKSNQAADIMSHHERKDRVGIYCACCGLEETYYNQTVEKDQRTVDFVSEIYFGDKLDYLLYFCSPQCYDNRPAVCDDRVPEERKYLFADLTEKEDPILSL